MDRSSVVGWWYVLMSEKCIHFASGDIQDEPNEDQTGFEHHQNESAVRRPTDMEAFHHDEIDVVHLFYNRCIHLSCQVSSLKQRDFYVVGILWSATTASCRLLNRNFAIGWFHRYEFSCWSLLPLPETPYIEIFTVLFLSLFLLVFLPFLSLQF